MQYEFPPRRIVGDLGRRDGSHPCKEGPRLPWFRSERDLHSVWHRRIGCQHGIRFGAKAHTCWGIQGEVQGAMLDGECSVRSGCEEPLKREGDPPSSFSIRTRREEQSPTCRCAFKVRGGHPKRQLHPLARFPVNVERALQSPSRWEQQFAPGDGDRIECRVSTEPLGCRLQATSPGHIRLHDGGWLSASRACRDNGFRDRRGGSAARNHQRGQRHNRRGVRCHVP